MHDSRDDVHAVVRQGARLADLNWKNKTQIKYDMDPSVTFFKSVNPLLLTPDSDIPRYWLYVARRTGSENQRCMLKYLF